MFLDQLFLTLTHANAWVDLFRNLPRKGRIVTTFALCTVYWGPYLFSSDRKQVTDGKKYANIRARVHAEQACLSLSAFLTFFLLSV